MEELFEEVEGGEDIRGNSPTWFMYQICEKGTSIDS